MSLRVSIAALLLLFAAGPVRAAEVLKVGKDSTNLAISHDGTRSWVVKDRVCVLQRAREIACGVVMKSAGKGAIVRLDAPNYDIAAGDKVISKFGMRAPTAVEPNNAVLLNSVPQDSDSEAHLFNVAAGVNVGTSFFYPVLNFNVAVTPNLAVGLSGTFLQATTDPFTLTGIGGYVGLNYYSFEYFRGFWVQVAGGIMGFSVNGDPLVPSDPGESSTSLLGFATVGWRGYWDLGINVGVAAGLQYIADPNFTSITASASGFRPMILVDLGFNF